MQRKIIIDNLEKSPIIAATDKNGWETALLSDAEILFHLNANIMTIKDEIKSAKEKNKLVFVHIDLADGIGRDKTGICWLKNLEVDGIISTRTNLIRNAKECGLLTVQRFFVLDSKGMHSIIETIDNTNLIFFIPFIKLCFL